MISKDYLSAAKQIAVDQVLLPSNVQSDIDQIQTKINSSASTLANKTQDNSEDVKSVIESVRVALMVVSAVMLLLTVLGFGFLKSPITAQNLPRLAQASGGKFTCIPVIGGNSLTWLFFESIGTELAHFPTPPALTSQFW
ncbi:unnamed protein product [Fraxinus pennsylvanica]|uniref:Uncharacterized protein n=1 Tax=Fraxinus pennsylvanica TaxID=56036 RepID=A0AAD1ZLA5_9LAMI|nr:unnamed protein product [Fraxinus pennsylvanica]